MKQHEDPREKPLYIIVHVTKDGRPYKTVGAIEHQVLAESLKTLLWIDALSSSA